MFGHCQHRKDLAIPLAAPSLCTCRCRCPPTQLRCRPEACRPGLLQVAVGMTPKHGSRGRRDGRPTRLGRLAQEGKWSFGALASNQDTQLAQLLQCRMYQDRAWKRDTITDTGMEGDRTRKRVGIAVRAPVDCRREGRTARAYLGKQAIRRAVKPQLSQKGSDPSFRRLKVIGAAFQSGQNMRRKGCATRISGPKRIASSIWPALTQYMCGTKASWSACEAAVRITVKH